MSPFLFVSVGVLSLTAGAESAQSVRLFSWQPTSHHAPWVLPQFGDETPKQSLLRYLNAVIERSQIHSVLPPDQMESFRRRVQNSATLDTREVVPDVNGRAQVALLANRYEDYQERGTGRRIFLFADRFGENGARSYMLPVVADLGLNVVQAGAFRTQVAETFNALVAMGGSDVDPYFYREKVTGAVNLNRLRDLSELRMMRTYIEAKKGFCMGVCRGHQLIATAFGLKLVQDIPTERAQETTLHRHSQEGWTRHPVRILPSGQGLFRRIFGPKESFVLSSYHHQAVIFREGQGLQLAAVSGRIVEGYELVDGRGFGVQGHPEYEDTRYARKIFARIVTEIKNWMSVAACERAL